MRFFTLLFTLLCAHAFAAGEGNTVRWGDMGWSTSTRKAGVTKAATTYYVRTTGSDSYNCTSASTPCLTIQGVANKIPKDIYHATDIDVGAGNFAGAVFEGFTPHPRPGVAAYLHLKGTMSTSTGLASGSATGTVTAFSSISGSTLPVLTDSNQNWTNNDLRGKFVQLSTSSTALYAITANTSTTLTIPLASGISVGATYTIVEPGTVINSAHSASTVADSQAGIQSRCLTITGGGSQAGSFPSIQVSRITFSCNSSTLVGVEGPTRTYFRWVRAVGGASTFQAMQFGHNASVVVQNSVVNMTTCSSSTLCIGISGAYATVRQTGASNLHLSGNLVWGGGTGILAGGSFVLISSSQLYAQNTEGLSGHAAASYSLSMQVASTRIDCNSTGATGIFVGSNSPDGGGYGVFSIGVNGANVSNCAIGVAVNGLNGAVLKTLTGTGNTIGISAIRGGRIQVYSDVDITGDTELDYDGTSSTLANMRAQTPKHVKNSNYFTVIYE